MIGERIRDLREDRGYSQKDLAKVLNITPGCLSKYENDRIQIPIDILISISDVLKVSVDYLVGKHCSKIDYNKLNCKYIDDRDTLSLLNDILSLNSSNRKILNYLLQLMVLKEEIDRIK